MGMSDNPLYAPSSSRKNIKESHGKNKQLDSKGLSQKNLHSNLQHHQKNSSKFNSEKIIEESRVKSC